MIPGGDHNSRTLLLRQVSSYSEVPGGPASPSTRHNTPTHTPRLSSSSYAFWDEDVASLPSLNMTDPADDANHNDLSRPLLPSLEYEESSHGGSVVSVASSIHAPPTNWKLWVGFLLLVTTGVGNVIFAKLQALPMYNYPTFLNMYANLLYIVMSFAYIIPVTFFGWFDHSIPWSHLKSMSKKPFFIMGCLDAIGAAMQVLATVYLPGTLLVLIPQAAIPLSMCAGAFLLGEKYTANQYLGASVVFCGILVVLYPVFTHQNAADHYCQAKDLDNDCILCEMETTEEACLSHLKRRDNILLHDSTAFISFLTAGNRTDDKDFYCTWVSGDEMMKHEDWLVFCWSIVMLISCVPSVMSTVYKQVALQAPLDPILVNGWVALFQFCCGIFLVVPSGLVSSPKVHPLDLGKNWLNAMECLFTSTNSVHVGCHPDDCIRAALWVHVSLVNSAVYALAMIFVLKYGGCDLMYLGLTLVVPLGHLAFSLHSSFSATSVYDGVGLLVLVVGLFLYRFGYEKPNDLSGSSNDNHEQNYEPLVGGDGENAALERGENVLLESSGLVSMTMNGNVTKEGFFEFLREPFMLVGDI